MPAVAGRHGRRLDLVALVHHPLCLETGLDPATAARLRASERRALAACRGVIVTSPSTAATLEAGFAVPRERIAAATSGAAPAPPAAGTGDGSAAQRRTTGRHHNRHFQLDSLIPRLVHSAVRTAPLLYAKLVAS